MARTELLGLVSSPVSDTTQSIADNGTITPSHLGMNTLVATSTAADKTGVILDAGVYPGQRARLINTSSNKLTFAASGTSRVAGGTGANVPALQAVDLVWSGALWYQNAGSAGAGTSDFGATGIKTDVIAESTGAAGVTIDGAVNASLGGSTAAAGTTTADATVLPAATDEVYPTTGADDTKGVRLHASDKVTGRKVLIGNGVSNKILKVYPVSGGTINGAAADAAFSSASGKGVVFVCLDSTANTWLAW